MAKYLRPRRGTQSNAKAQNFVLKSGEMFMEIPSGTMGKTPGRIILGDGSTAYSLLNYATTSSSSYQPFITDPMLYTPIFSNSTYATSDWTVNAATAAISGMGNGTGQVTLPTILGKIKEALCKHEDSITALDGSLAAKQDAATAINTSNIASQTVNSSTYSANSNTLRVYNNSGSLYSNRFVKCQYGKGDQDNWFYLYLDHETTDIRYTAVNAADWATAASKATDADYATGARSNFTAQGTITGNTITGNILKSNGIVYANGTAPCLYSYAVSGQFERIESIQKRASENYGFLNMPNTGLQYSWEINNVSDQRLKKNIKDTEVNGLDTINKIKLHSFDFIDEKYGKHQEIGYIAQEVKEIVPEMVVSVRASKEDKEKYKTDELYQVGDKALIKYLVKAVQELTEIVGKQQKEIKELKK